MAAPSFVSATTGGTDAGGAWDTFADGSLSTNNVFIFQVLQDGTTSDAVTISTVSGSMEDLAGTDQAMTFIGSFAGGGLIQHLWIGRGTQGVPTTMRVTGENSTSEDLYWRFYVFKNVNTGTTLAEVIENASSVFSAATGNSTDSAVGAGYDFAFAFTALADVSKVGLKLSKNGTPAADLKIAIQADSSGPDGTDIDFTTVSQSSLTTTRTLYTYDISATGLTVGNTYWVVCSTNSSDVSNHYYWEKTASTAGTTMRSAYPGGAWSDVGTNDLTLEITWGGGATTTSSGTGTDIADAGVTTIGPDRLALQFVGVNDDNAVGQLATPTGGAWIEPVAEYSEASGTDATIGLQCGRPTTVDYPSISGGNSEFGSTARIRAAQSFTVSSAVSVAGGYVKLSKTGTPADNVEVAIQADSGGNPSGTDLASVTVVAGGSIPTFTSDQIYEYTFGTPLSLSASTTYWLVYRRSGSSDASNYYYTYIATGGAPGQGKFWNGSTWSSIAGDYGHQLFTTGSSGGFGTIDGGSYTMAASDGWGVVGFALIGTTVTETVYVPRYAFTNFQGPGVF